MKFKRLKICRKVNANCKFALREVFLYLVGYRITKQQSDQACGKIKLKKCQCQCLVYLVHVHSVFTVSLERN